MILVPHRQLNVAVSAEKIERDWKGSIHLSSLSQQDFPNFHDFGGLLTAPYVTAVFWLTGTWSLTGHKGRIGQRWSSWSGVEKKPWFPLEKCCFFPTSFCRVTGVLKKHRNGQSFGGWVEYHPMYYDGNRQNVKTKMQFYSYSSLPRLTQLSTNFPSIQCLPLALAMWNIRGSKQNLKQPLSPNGSAKASGHSSIQE